MSWMKRQVTGAIVAVALGVSTPALAGYCEDVFDECYRLTMLETDERARDARQNQCYDEYGQCLAQGGSQTQAPSQSAADDAALACRAPEAGVAEQGS